MLKRRTSILGAGCAVLVLAAAQAAACAPAPPVVRDIDANRYYSDPASTIIDPVLKARNEAAVKPVADYLDGVAKMASSFHAAPAAHAADARCALGWLDSWARQDGMLGKMTTNQSYYMRKWTLAGLALSYAKLKPAATEAEKRRIDAWLQSLADATIVHAEAYTGVRNNHYYWEGLAVTATGAVTGNARQLAWGRKVFDHAMEQVQPDGTLPREMARQGRALQYHSFSAAPLVMMASILDLDSPRLDSLVRFTLDAIADPAVIETKSGHVQGKGGGTPAWKAVYDRRSPAPRPPYATDGWQARMGGDLSLPNPLEHPVRAR